MRFYGVLNSIGTPQMLPVQLIPLGNLTQAQKE